ncbi:MAG: NTP transferase domain-containing protein [Clostridia bacterium]|nr:NTP transferase domain-containing protein [Clostridia bacterium]
MKDTAAIILCAGKGSRMNDNSKSKVCFDCAGVPVIRRIIDNMKQAGVSRFVVVIGHQAYSVMDCLDGVDGVIYAYQKEQKGTGHAALCGLKALSSMGYDGPVIISMGDKIISTDVIRGIVEKSESADAVWGVQPLAANFNGGRVVVREGKPYGVIEFTDAALMALGNTTPDNYENMLAGIGLNPKKAKKVLDNALTTPPAATKKLCGVQFEADEVLSAPYANAALYCFNTNKVIDAISTLGSDNAQGEIYLTDTLEYFAAKNSAVLYEIPSKNDMLTYSTKQELCKVSEYFMRTASQYIFDIENGNMDAILSNIYGADIENQKIRYTELLNKFIAQYGDKKVVITRSPGRINLMGRHIDHRGGGINVMATDKDQVFVSARRDDDIVNIANIDPAYPDRSFSISETLSLGSHDSWLDYLASEKVVEALKLSRGDWSNYVKSAVIHAQFKTDYTLCGMDMVSTGNIPVAAGLSSSSAIVVAVMEALVALNCLNLTEREFIDLCGEGEWFVGSRGGSGDHAAMKCGQKDAIVHLGFKPFTIGEKQKFSDKYAVLVANSMLMAKKSEGSKDTFNAKVACYEFALMLLKKNYPSYELKEFRDLAKIRPYSRVYEMIASLPETVTRGGIKFMIPEYKDRLEVIFSNHKDPLVYELRNVALYGISECERAEKFMTVLKSEDYVALGNMMKISHDGDRLGATSISDAHLEKLIANNTPFETECGSYKCSTPEIDYLCDLLNSTDGVLGSEIVGAGLGGCVIALIEKSKSDDIISGVNREYYDKYGFAHAANVYSASSGSSVIF